MSAIPDTFKDLLTTKKAFANWPRSIPTARPR
jgi:hypothetical protein